MTLPHRWDLPDIAAVEIRPVPGSYEYINGSFRPDPERILKLLSGTALYSTPLAAIREVVQNAFDAVREDMAHVRLRQFEPLDPALAEELARRYIVELTLHSDLTGRWLVCRDNGAGMTKSIIENCLLVSGRSQRGDLVALERRCREKGFSMERTGQFGIGAMSYFMVSDWIEIQTRRSQSCGDDEKQGWQFASSGLFAFGELRAIQLSEHGTEARLRLTPSFRDQDETTLTRSLQAYLQTELVNIPCCFRLVVNGSTELTLQPGWVLGRMDIEQRLVGSMARTRHINESEQVALTDH